MFQLRVKASLLKLESITFHKVAVEAQPNPCNDADISITDSVELFRNDTERDRWRIELTLVISAAKSDVPPPYSGELKLSGSFRVATDVSEIASGNLVRVNGCSILYSAAREMFANLTARGPHPMQLLPSRTFIDMKVEADGNTGNQTKEERTGP